MVTHSRAHPYRPMVHELPVDLQARVREIVAADEQLVWVGRPVATRQWLIAYTTAVGGAIALACFLWFSGAWRMLEDGPAAMPWFLGGMVVMMMILPAAIPLLIGRHRLYLLTTQRAIIAGPQRFGIDLSRSYRPHQLHAMVCRRVFGGVGDLIIERRSGSKNNVYYGFRSIRDPHEVQRLIEATLLSDTPYATNNPDRGRPRILCSPIATDNASFRTSELKRTSNNVLQMVSTMGARMFGAIMLVFGIVLLGTAAGLYLTGQYQRIGRVNELPLGGIALLIFLSVFAIVVTVLSLRMIFRSSVSFDRSSRSIRGGSWPRRWVRAWDDVCCVQGIEGVHESSSESSYQTYELNLVFGDDFSRQNLSCHADRQATVEMGAQLAAFMDRPWLDWITDAQGAEAMAEALRDRH